MSVASSNFRAREISLIQQNKVVSQWEISFFPNDDVVWSIFLAYLHSIKYDPKEITNRLGILGAEKIDKNIKNRVKNYNPFLHKYASFYYDGLKSLVEGLRYDIEEFKRKHGKLDSTSNENYKNNIEAASSLLSCNIVALNFREMKLEDVFHNAMGGKIYRISLTLLKHVVNGQVRFEFAIPETTALEKQKMALQQILKEARITDLECKKKMAINTISRLPTIGKNFLISLLKSDAANTIPFIYKSPYVLAKLQWARFQTDPTICDEVGNCGLFYALTLHQADLLYFLYDYCVNAYLPTENGEYSPILNRLGEILHHMKSKLSKNVQDGEELKKKVSIVDGLCRFNNFQIEIHSSLSGVASQLLNDILLQAAQRKKIILSILNIYDKYFKWSDPQRDVENTWPLVFDFLEHAEYFDQLDFCASIMFFNYWFLLKERLTLSDDHMYLQTESRFFLFIFCKKYFETLNINMGVYKDIVLKMVLFQDRLSLQKQLLRFKNSLDNTLVDNGNVVRQLPQDAVLTLTDLPHIFDAFLLFRLRHYLNAAINVTIKDTKSILVVERALHVIGESMNKLKIYFETVKRLLPLALPAEIVTHFKQIRNVLTHFKIYHLPWRISAEQDIALFKTIQAELKTLKNILTPVFFAHENSMERFMLSLVVNAVKKASEQRNSEESKSQLADIFQTLHRANTNNDSRSSQKTWKDYFKEVYSKLQSHITNINRCNDVVTKITVNRYKYILENLFVCAKAELGKLKSNASDLDEGKKSVNECMWSVEYILRVISTNKTTESYRRKILKLIKARKAICNTAYKKVESSDGNKNNDLSDDVIYSQGNVNTFNSEESMRTGQEYKDTTLKFRNVNDETFSHLEHRSDELNGTAVYAINVAEQTHLEEIEPNSQCDNVTRSLSSSSSDDLCLDLFLEEENVTPENERLSSENDSVLQNIANGVAAHSLDGCQLAYQEKPESVSDMIGRVEVILLDYETITRDIFNRVSQKGNKNIEFTFTNIEKLRRVLNGWYFLNGIEKKRIKQNVPSTFKTLHEDKCKLKSFLEKSRSLTKEDIQDIVCRLPMRESDVTYFLANYQTDVANCLQIINSVPDHYAMLLDEIDKDEIEAKRCDTLCDKLHLPEDSRTLLRKLAKGQRTQAPGKPLEFFRSRIRQLKLILIEENKDIEFLWQMKSTAESRTFLNEKLIHIFLSDPEVQSSVEMLLFDCMSLFKNLCDKKVLEKFQEKFQSLWRKTKNLFNGISLRNVLAHGNPLMESLCRLLDPNDLPSELISEMLGFVADAEAVDAMIQLLEETGTDYSGFVCIMNEDDSSFKELCRTIRKCERWTYYAHLIPEATTRGTRDETNMNT